MCHCFKPAFSSDADEQGSGVERGCSCLPLSPEAAMQGLRPFLVSPALVCIAGESVHQAHTMPGGCSNVILEGSVADWVQLTCARLLGLPSGFEPCSSCWCELDRFIINQPLLSQLVVVKLFAVGPWHAVHIDSLLPAERQVC